MAQPEPTAALSFYCDSARAAAPADPFADALSRDRARLRQLALRITRDPAAADDVFQSALEKALRHRAEFRGDAKPSTWLHRIVVNEALAWRRSECRRARHLLAAQAEPTAATAVQPLDELLVREWHERVLRALDGLRADERELLARFALDGGYADWASAARTTTTAAKTRAFRARQALRAALAESDRPRR